jgi:hypothetical protein
MTCVVFKDGILASDSQLVSRSWTCVGDFKKIGTHTVDGVTYGYGATGETAYCQKFSDWIHSPAFALWLSDGSGHPNLEPAGKDEVCTGILFKPDGSCVRFEGNYPPFTLRAPFYAFGSGDALAMGAMAAGATAHEAVEIACKFDVLSNGPVQSMPLVGYSPA